jgi:superfamily II DNA or RNA helicase
MSVFNEYKERFILEPKTGSGLRKCQLGAIWALKSYFISNTPEVAALISLPTGSGKSAIMMAACFELNLKKSFNYRTIKSIKNSNK